MTLFAFFTSLIWSLLSLRFLEEKPGDSSPAGQTVIEKSLAQFWLDPKSADYTEPIAKSWSVVVKEPNAGGVCRDNSGLPIPKVQKASMVIASESPWDV